MMTGQIGALGVDRVARAAADDAWEIGRTRAGLPDRRILGVAAGAARERLGPFNELTVSSSCRSAATSAKPFPVVSGPRVKACRQLGRQNAA